MSDSRKDRQRKPRLRLVRRTQSKQANVCTGRGQLSLIEHALCPLETDISLTEGLIHEVEYFYTDESRHKKLATAKVAAPYGLSPNDEFYLWGLLALTFQQPEPSTEFHATRYYILKQLGCSGESSSVDDGGENYRLLRTSLERLSAVNYKSDYFYDPIRGEHRQVSFGLLDYSLPKNPKSPRAWRIVWNTQFFEFCKAAGGYLFFDLDTYRELDFASRRLFLALKKVFYRSAVSPAYDVQHLGVNVLGFAASTTMWNLKIKLARCADRLADRRIIELPNAGPKGLFEKKGVGSYSIRFQRGSYFDKPEVAKPPALATESALYDPLKSIGFDDEAIVKIIATYKAELVQTWADITLAAKERMGPGFFKRSPQAFFMDSVQKAAQGIRTPPDWWLDYRKEEDRRKRQAEREALAQPTTPEAEKSEEAAFEEYLRGEARDAVRAIVEDKVKRLVELGYAADQAAAIAARNARKEMETKFRQDHPEYEKSTGFQCVGDILKKKFGNLN